MNIDQNFARQACYQLGLVEPINIETDGKTWLGNDPNDKQWVDETTQDAIYVKTRELYQSYLLANPA